MGVIAMGAIAGGSALFSSLMGGQQQKTQNAIQRAQFEEQQLQARLQNQIKNRQIAQANAAKWMANRNLGKAANKARAEKEFWLGYNFDNASGQFSRGYQKMNSQLQSVVTGRNIDLKSGNSRQLMNAALNQTKRGFVSQRVQHGNALLSAERQQKAVLAKRDFGYASQVKFMEGTLYQQSDSSIMSMALTTGLVTGALSGVSTGISAALKMRAGGYEGSLVGADAFGYLTGG